jgi:hypothetical protein
VARSGRLRGPHCKGGAVGHRFALGIFTALKIDDLPNYKERTTVLTDEQNIKYLLQNETRRDLSELKREGVPKAWKALLNATSKQKAERLAKAMMTDVRELARLAYCCGDLGFRRRFKVREHIPEQAAISKEEMATFVKSPYVKPGEKPSSAQQARARKIIALFDTTKRLSPRKILTAHLFERSAEWHFIYFDASDAYGGARGHGKLGKHIHFGSHLFQPGVEVEKVWAALDERDVRLPTIHIRLSRSFG